MESYIISLDSNYYNRLFELHELEISLIKKKLIRKTLKDLKKCFCCEIYKEKKHFRSYILSDKKINYHKECYACQQKNKVYKNDINRISYAIRSRISTSIRQHNMIKDEKTEKILGCTFYEFKNHIQSQFVKGMSFDNYGEWELDHIIPCSIAKNKKHLYELNKWHNFQPLWKKDNRVKSSKIPLISKLD